MIKKKILSLIPLTIILACGNDEKNFPAEQEDKLDFSADPNSCNYFQEKFFPLVTFVSKSIEKNSSIGPDQIKECIRYILRYGDLQNFYEQFELFSMPRHPCAVPYRKIPDRVGFCRFEAVPAGVFAAALG